MTSMKVLIVDDNQLICFGLGRMLSRLSLFHRAVEDGANALAEVRATFYDLVFLDIRLPDANGLDLMKELRWVSPETKIVIISSDGSETNVRRALSEGALRFLHKPFDPSEVEEALAAAFPFLRWPMRVPDGKVAPTPTRISGSGTEETDT
jgi:DNA-binding NtrC family response regulator